MRGSEKQVEWAKKITAAWIMAINKIVDEANGRVARNSMPQAWADVCATAAQEIIAKINAMDDAAIIIRDRTAPVARSVFEIASVRYAKINN